jgi:ATP-binding cassette subfamily B multidrug efflux pump
MSILKSRNFSLLYLKEKRTLILIIAVCLVLASIIGFYTPKIVTKLFNSYDNEEYYFGMIKLLGFFAISEYVIRICYQVAMNKYVQHLLNKVRKECYQVWLLSYEAIEEGKSSKDRYPLGEVLARIMSDTESVKELITSGSFSIPIDFLFIISCLIGFVTLNTVSGVTIIIAEILASAFLVYLTKYMAKVYMETRSASGKVSKILANVSAGMPQMYYSPNERYASKKSYDSFEDFLKIQLKANVWDASYFSMAESLYPILLFLLVLIFPYSNIVEVGVFAAIIDLIQRSIGPIKNMTGKISNIQRARTGVIRIFEFQDDLRKYPASSLDQNSKEIEFKSIDVKVKHFKYDKSDFALTNIEFTGKRGELIGLVGMSGCGKSTLLRILSANILCPSATVIIHSSNEKKIELNYSNNDQLNDYRQYISIVSQDSHVFTESLRYNISFSSEKTEDFTKYFNEIKKQIPYLAHWGVEEDDIIKPKELSLGQKQVISALRSVYLNKPIVLFDEISSGLDAELELALRKLVLLIQKKALTIIVAHRIETIVESNKIIVLDDGAVIGMGSHSELLKTNRIYQEFITEIS